MSGGSDRVLATRSDPGRERVMTQNERRTPKQERAQATVDAVVEAAARILVEDGYARLSTNKVATRAGVSVGTLYQYFSDKEAIVAAIVDRLAEERIGTFASTLLGMADADIELEDGLRILLDATLAAMRVRPQLARRLMLEAPRGGRLDLEHEWKTRCTEIARSVMYRRREKVRAGDVDLMAHVVITAAFAVLTDAVAWRPELIDTDVLRDELAALAARYLEPRSA
jgi:AcrR family transcriptional regulator